ncbi:MAG TPA: protein kinase [Kofleriaceae bacterium]|nr:protein kinase [Kofleriaceae bacterium]
MSSSPVSSAPRSDITHLDDNAAAEFVSGGMTPAAQSRIEGHLASCRDCRELVAALAMDAGTDSHADTLPQQLDSSSSSSQASQRPTRTLAIGDRVGRYLVLSALGAGGMGVVFSAYDPQLDRKVALKLLRAGITYNTKDARTRLRREAQAIAQLSHPNVVGVYDVGNTDEGDLYIAMEFVDGETLTSWLKRYPRTWRDIVDIYLQAARGLLAAHSVGLLHRDFKPDNVLVGSDGRVRVTDFGLARSVITPEDAARVPGRFRRPSSSPGPSALNVELTATGTVLGTPRYMAPEQLKGPDIDHRADQFSFSVALYEALYGMHPLPGSTAVSMLEKHEKAQPPPEIVKGIPPTIARAIMTGLERDRAKRFPTMSALISALVPPQQRSPARYAAIALGGLMVAGITVAAIWPTEPVAVVLPPEQDPIPVLLAKINELQAEKQELIEKFTRIQPDLEKIRQLTNAIAARDEQIQQLVLEVAELKGVKLPAKPPPVPTKPPPPQEFPPGVFNSAQDDLRSCFREWSRRASGNAELSFKMTVGANGVGGEAMPWAVPADDERLGPSLRTCVGLVLQRVPFKKGNDNLDLVVDVRWNAEAQTSAVSAHIVGRRGSTIDL